MALALNVVVKEVMDMHSVQTSHALNKTSVCKVQPMHEGVHDIHPKHHNARPFPLKFPPSPYCPLNLI